MLLHVHAFGSCLLTIEIYGAVFLSQLFAVQAEREELIAARRAATQVAPPSIDSVPIGAPLREFTSDKSHFGHLLTYLGPASLPTPWWTAQYLRETVEPDAGQYVYDFYVAYLDQPEGAGDVDLTVEEWAAEEDPQEAAERAQDLDEDSNDGQSALTGRPGQWTVWKVHFFISHSFPMHLPL